MILKGSNDHFIGINHSSHEALIEKLLAYASPWESKWLSCSLLSVGLLLDVSVTCHQPRP